MLRIHLSSFYNSCKVKEFKPQNNSNVFAIQFDCVNKKYTKKTIREIIYLSTGIKVKKVCSLNVVKFYRIKRITRSDSYRKFIAYLSNADDYDNVVSRIIKVQSS